MQHHRRSCFSYSNLRKGFRERHSRCLLQVEEEKDPLNGERIVSAITLTMRAGNNYLNHKGGCGPLEAKQLSLTLSCVNSQILFVFRKKKTTSKEKGK